MVTKVLGLLALVLLKFAHGDQEIFGNEYGDIAATPDYGMISFLVFSFATELKSTSYRRNSRYSVF